MKKIFILSTILCTLVIATFAQERIELKTLAQDVKISVKDSFAIINIDGNIDSFKVSKKANERHFVLSDPADKQKLEKMLLIDKGEIKNLFEVAFPKIDAIDQVINRAAAGPAGILLASKEAGGVPAGTNDEIGGQTVVGGAPDSSHWLAIAIAGIAGLILGFIIAALMKNKNNVVDAEPAIKSEEEINFEETIAPVKDDAKKVTDAAKAKISKLQADKKLMQADLKAQKAEITNLQTQVTQVTQFHKTYYTHLMKDIINPMNDALEKGSQSAATSYLLKLAAHTTSITRHELGMKQAYDSVNIAIMLKQQLPTNLNIETINSDTPRDRVPNNILNVQALMENNGTQSLDNVVIFGYRIG